MNEIKIAIVGCNGLRAKGLFPLFNNPKLGSRVVLGIDKSEDIKSLENSDADAVVVCSPDWLHKEHSVAALEMGKHVYIEKPMAITSDECRLITEAARVANRKVFVGHNLRHFTVFKKMKEVISSGKIGTVMTIWCRHFVSYGGEAYFQDWHALQKNVGSLLIHKGCHDLDLIHWFADSFSSRVIASGNLLLYGKNEKLSEEMNSASFGKVYPPGEMKVHPGVDVEDAAMVFLTLKNGVTAQYSQCHFTPISCREYTIIGTEGMIENIGDHPSDAVVNLFTQRHDRRGTPTQSWTFESEKGHHGKADERIVEEFLSLIRDGAEPIASLEAAVESVKASEAATISMRNGSVLVEIK